MRKHGMYERERKTRKWEICILYTVCAVFCAVIGVFHAWRALNAKKINDLELSSYCDESSPCYVNMFDQCNFPKKELSNFEAFEAKKALEEA